MSKSYPPEHYVPMETSDLKHSPNCIFYVNGDQFFPGSRLCISNRIRTFDGVKDELTNVLFKNQIQVGHVRNIFTPVGGSRVNSLDEFKDGQHYVAALNDKFQPLNYKEIPDKSRPSHLKGYKKIDIGHTYIPVQHALEERLRKKSGRSYYLNEHRRGLRLRVHVNGMNERPSCPVSIRYKDKDHFVKILEEIEVTLNLQPIERIYKIVNQGGYPENFTEITNVDQFEADEHILVLPKNDKRLQVKFYSLEGKNNFKVTTSPRAGQYYLYPSFPLDNSSFHHNKSLNKHKPLPSIGSSKNDTMSPLSNPPGSNGGGRRKANKNKLVKQVDYDKDEGGVYRAKTQNNSQGAPQVYETKATRIYQPIHHTETEIFKEEDTEELTSPVPAVKPNSKTLPVEPVKNSKSKSQARHTEEKIKQESGMHHIDEYEEDSFNRFDLHNASGTQSKDPWASTPASRGEARRKQELREQQAVAKIQAGARGYKVRKEYKAKKSEIAQHEAEQKVTDLTREQANQKNLDQDIAASKIQASFRGYKTRKEVSEKRQQVRESKDDEKSKAALKIQSGYRGYKVRKAYNKRKMQIHNELETSNKVSDGNLNANLADELERQAARQEAAIKIQSNYRGYRTRRELKEKQSVNKDDTKGILDKKTMNKDDASIVIQSGYRGYKTRKNFADKGKEKPLDNQKDEKIEAASKIQASFKGYKVRTELTERKQKKELTESAQQEAAAKIQAFYRGYNTRKKLVKPKEPQLSDPAPLPETVYPNTNDNAEINKAATDGKAAAKIQSSYRGYITRKEYKAKVTDDTAGTTTIC